TILGTTFSYYYSSCNSTHHISKPSIYSFDEREDVKRCRCKRCFRVAAMNPISMEPQWSTFNAA
ncbi:hypothetical protein DMN91_004470, partial [Ooceraea biroi]